MIRWRYHELNSQVRSLLCLDYHVLRGFNLNFGFMRRLARDSLASDS